MPPFQYSPSRICRSGSFLLIVALALTLSLSSGGCAKSPPADAGGSGGAGGSRATTPGEIHVSVTERRARTATVGLNYWQWSPSYGNNIAGTETAAAALAPSYLRMGGHNNDNNMPDPFNAAEIDRAVAYARAVGAQPILQVPLLADETGSAPTAATAAAMVTYANVTQTYAIQYFSIGNEADLYPDQEATRPGYTPTEFCASARSFVTAMKAVDSSIKIVGPDLSWKYQAGSASNDWMTPILTMCGDLFDVVSFHRYPFAPTAATASSAAGDAPALRTIIASLRAIMKTAGQADKPLALTETNITYDGTPSKSTLDASPGTVPAGLWAADMLGMALDQGLWTTLLWSTSEGWTLGLITPQSEARVERPAYHAVRLFAEHFGPTLIDVTATPAGVRAYASRDAADTVTQLIVINWNLSDLAITFSVAGLPTAIAPVKLVLPARSFAAVEVPDGAAAAQMWSYGAAEWATHAGPTLTDSQP